MAQGDWGALRTSLYFYGVPYYMTISGQRLSFTGSDFFGQFQGAIVTRPATMTLGGMRVTAQVRGPNNVAAYLLIAAAWDWSQYVAVGIRNVGVDIWTGATFPVLTQKNQALATIVDGDYISIDWLSGADRYDVYHHTTLTVPVGATPILSWTDSSHILLHGAAYQYAGALLSMTGYTPCAQLQSFAFKDIGAVTPVAPPGNLPYSLPFPLPAPSFSVGPATLSPLTIKAPIPSVLERVAPALSPITLLAPVPVVSGVAAAPISPMSLLAPVPKFQERIVAPIGVLKLIEPGASLPNESPNPGPNVLTLTAPTPTVREIVSAPIGVLQLTEPLPTVLAGQPPNHNFNRAPMIRASVH